jgi:hypothetical protein
MFLNRNTAIILVGFTFVTCCCVDKKSNASDSKERMLTDRESCEKVLRKLEVNSKKDGKNQLLDTSNLVNMTSLHEYLKREHDGHFISEDSLKKLKEHSSPAKHLPKFN